MKSRKMNLKFGAGTGTAVAAIALACTLAPTASAGNGGGGCANANTNSTQLSSKEARTAIVCLFNQERSGGDVAKQGNLQKAAQRHTDTMRNKDCFDHKCPGEPNLKKRVKQSGYTNGANKAEFGEVISYGPDNQTPAEVVDNWIDSSAHKALIRRGSFDDVGVGVSTNGSGTLYTAVLGNRN